MTCNKTDFRMYQPLMGQPEEICWTCGKSRAEHTKVNTSTDTQRAISDLYKDNDWIKHAINGLKATSEPSPMHIDYANPPKPCAPSQQQKQQAAPSMASKIISQAQNMYVASLNIVEIVGISYEDFNTLCYELNLGNGLFQSGKVYLAWAYGKIEVLADRHIGTGAVHVFQWKK